MVISEIEIVDVDALINQRAFNLNDGYAFCGCHVHELLLAAMAKGSHFLGA